MRELLSFFVDLIVAIRGSVMVSWRRGSLRVALVGALAAVAVVAATGGLWLAGGAPNQTAPSGDAAPGEQADADESDTGAGMGDGPATPTGPASSNMDGTERKSPDAVAAADAGADTADDRAADDRASGAHLVGSDPLASGAPVDRLGSPTTIEPGGGPSPSVSTPGTTIPASGDPPSGPSSTTTTTSATPPPDDGAAGSDDGLVGGLLGGVLDLLRASA